MFNPVLSLTIAEKIKLRLLVLSLASLDPLLEQVFIVAVSPRPKREDPFVGELSAVCVNEHGHQAVLFACELVDQLHYLIYNFLRVKNKMTINVET